MPSKCSTPLQQHIIFHPLKSSQESIHLYMQNIFKNHLQIVCIQQVVSSQTCVNSTLQIAQNKSKLFRMNKSGPHQLAGRVFYEELNMC